MVRGRPPRGDGGAWLPSVPAAMRAGVRSVPIAAGHDCDDLTWLARRIATGELVPILGRRYGAAEVGRAHAELGSGETCGARIIDHRDAPAL